MQGITLLPDVIPPVEIDVQKPSQEYFDGQSHYREGDVLAIAVDPTRQVTARDRKSFPWEVEAVADSNGTVPAAFTFVAMECLNTTWRERVHGAPSSSSVVDQQVVLADIPSRMEFRSGDALRKTLPEWKRRCAG